jgi:hypothetical protein
MEIFSHTYATAYGRSYAVTDEEYLQESLDPPNRLTTRELNQLREIREEIESRPRITRFEKRYIRVLETAEQELGNAHSPFIKEITKVRQLLREVERAASIEKHAIAISFLIATIANLPN